MRKKKYTYYGFVCVFIILITLSNFGRDIYAHFKGDKYLEDYTFPPDPLIGGDFQIWRYMALELLYGLPLYTEKDSDNQRWRDLDEQYKDGLSTVAEDTRNWMARVARPVRWNHLPLVGYFLIPFNSVGHPWSYRIYLCLLLSLLFCTLFLLSRYSRSRASYWMVSAVLVMFSYPLIFQLERGGLDMFPLLFIALAFFGWREKRNSLYVGLCVALAIHIKIYPLIFLYYFVLKKQWRICFSICSFTLLLMLACGLASHEGIVEGFTQYWKFYRSLRDIWILNPMMFAGNHSTFSFLGFLLQKHHLSKMQLLGISNIVNISLLAFISLIILIRKARDTFSLLLDFSLIIVASTLIPTHGLDYSLVLLYFVFLSCFICFERMDFNLLHTRVLFIFFSMNVITLFLPTMKIPLPTYDNFGGYMSRFWFLSNKWPFLVSFLIIICLLRRALLLSDRRRASEHAGDGAGFVNTEGFGRSPIKKN